MLRPAAGARTWAGGRVAGWPEGYLRTSQDASPVTVLDLSAGGPSGSAATGLGARRADFVVAGTWSPLDAGPCPTALGMTGRPFISCDPSCRGATGPPIASEPSDAALAPGGLAVADWLDDDLLRPRVREPVRGCPSAAMRTEEIAAEDRASSARGLRAGGGRRPCPPDSHGNHRSGLLLRVFADRGDDRVMTPQLHLPRLLRGHRLRGHRLLRELSEIH